MRWLWRRKNILCIWAQYLFVLLRLIDEVVSCIAIEWCIQLCRLYFTAKRRENKSYLYKRQLVYVQSAINNSQPCGLKWHRLLSAMVLTRIPTNFHTGQPGNVLQLLEQLAAGGCSTSIRVTSHDLSCQLSRIGLLVISNSRAANLSNAVIDPNPA